MGGDNCKCHSSEKGLIHQNSNINTTGMSAQIKHRLKYSQQPASDPKDYICGSQVGGNRMIFIKQYRAERGRIAYQYFLPESGTMIRTFRPMGYHLPR